MHLHNHDSKIFVAGHRGLVGSAVVRALGGAGYRNIVTRTRAELDLRDAAAVDAFFAAEQPAFVVLAAAKVGGILANDTYPADFLADNLALQSAVMGAAHRHGVGQRGRLVFLGSSCIYPKHAPQPMQEAHLLTGPLEPTNEAYAIAKIAGVKYAQALRKQHGDDVVSLMPTNLYGPGDNFDLHTSHVLPALLRKFHVAKGTGRPLTLWGTGTPRREFLYVDDLADAIRFVLEQPEAALFAAAPDGLFNAGVGEDITIRDLATLVGKVVGGDTRIEHDLSKPDGTPRKLMDVARLTALGWHAQTPLETGIRQTYDWFLRAAAGDVRGTNTPDATAASSATV